MADLKKGDRARLRPVVIEGEIVKHRFDEDTGAKFLRLQWNDPTTGEAHEREFPEAELEAVPAAEPAPDAAAA